MNTIALCARALFCGRRRRRRRPRAARTWRLRRRAARADDRSAMAALMGIPVRPCPAPGCSALLPIGGPSRCRAHARGREASRGSQRDRGYTWPGKPARGVSRALPALRRSARAPAAGRVELLGSAPGHAGDRGRSRDPAQGRSRAVLGRGEQLAALCARCHALKTNAGL